jgi:hypothetical protein
MICTRLPPRSTSMFAPSCSRICALRLKFVHPLIGTEILFHEGHIIGEVALDARVGWNRYLRDIGYPMPKCWPFIRPAAI